MAGAVVNPLARHEVLRTDDLEEMHAGVCRVFRPCEIEPGSPRRSLRFLGGVGLGGVHLASWCWGGEMTVRVPEFSDVHVVNLMHRGSMAQAQRGSEASTRGTHGLMTRPGNWLELRRSEDCQGIGIVIPKSVLERAIEDRCGVAVRGPVEFRPLIDLRRGWGRALDDQVRCTVDELARHGELPDGAAAALARGILDCVLFGFEHPYSGALRRRVPAAGAGLVDRVESYIAAHAGEAVDVGTLVDEAGVSASSLYLAFRRKRGYTPMEFLRRERLGMARERLEGAGAADSVSMIALGCGFGHFGRFSRAYREAYRECPSETLRRARERNGG